MLFTSEDSCTFCDSEHAMEWIPVFDPEFRRPSDVDDVDEAYRRVKVCRDCYDSYLDQFDALLEGADLVEHSLDELDGEFSVRESDDVLADALVTAEDDVARRELISVTGQLSDSEYRVTDAEEFARKVIKNSHTSAGDSS